MKKTIILLILVLFLSGCVEKEQKYSRVAERNYTENLTLFPDGQWVGVFYEDAYYPQLHMSGVYRFTDTQLILTTPTGQAIIFEKNGSNLTFEGKKWIKN